MQGYRRMGEPLPRKQDFLVALGAWFFRNVCLVKSLENKFITKRTDQSYIIRLLPQNDGGFFIFAYLYTGDT